MDGETTVALRKLGEVLIAEGSITEEQLAAAIAEQERTGERLGEILLASRSVSRLNLANAFAEQHAGGRRPSTSQPASPDSDPDLAHKLAQMEARLTLLARMTDELGGRLAALEALIAAISEALDSRST